MHGVIINLVNWVYHYKEMKKKLIYKLIKKLKIKDKWN